MVACKIVDPPLSDEQLDAMVLDLTAIRRIPDGPNLNNSIDASYLLTAIVDCAGDLLNRNYATQSKAKRLVEDNDELFEELKAAWRTQRFHRIRSLPILQRIIPARRSSGSGVTVATVVSRTAVEPAKGTKRRHKNTSRDAKSPKKRKSHSSPRPLPILPPPPSVATSSAKVSAQEATKSLVDFQRVIDSVFLGLAAGFKNAKDRTR